MSDCAPCVVSSITELLISELRKQMRAEHVALAVEAYVVLL